MPGSPRHAALYAARGVGLPGLYPGPATSWQHDFPSLIPFPHLEEDNNSVTELLKRSNAILPVKSLPFRFRLRDVKRGGIKHFMLVTVFP